MGHFILAGTEAVTNYQDGNFKELEQDILNKGDGEIYYFDYSEPNALSELLNQLNGWNDFIELSEAEVNEIKTKTIIEFKDNKDNNGSSEKTIKTSFSETKYFALTNSEGKVIAVIEVKPGSDITDKVIQAVSEDEDSESVEILNSFKMDLILTYIIKAKIIIDNAEDENYYNLTPIALY